MSTSNELFNQCAEAVKDLATKPGNDVLLQLYAHFKQSVVGDINTDRPGMLDFQGKAKWDVWNGIKGMTKEDAQSAYIKLVQSLQ